MSSTAGSSSERDPPWVSTLESVSSAILAISSDSNVSHIDRRKALQGILGNCNKAHNYFEAIRDSGQASVHYLVTREYLREDVFRALSGVQDNPRSIERMGDLINRLMDLAKEGMYKQNRIYILWLIIINE